MRKVLLSSCSIILLLCAWGTASGADSPTKDALIARFDQSDLATNNGNGYSLSTNESGALAWGESQFLEAYLDMYEGTGNRKYLDTFSRHAERIIANTDKVRNVKDYKGRSLVGWNATKYSFRKVPVVYLAHTGMIAYPLVRFSQIVRGGDFPETYRAAAERSRQMAVAALAEFNPNWTYIQESGEGFYRFDPDEPQTDNTPEPPMPVPFNQQIAAGRAFVLLCGETGDASFCEKAAGLARHFKNRIRRDANGAYVWNYWYDQGLKRYAAVEDYSHGAIDVEFVVLAYRKRIVFERSDIEGLLKTYRHNIFRNGAIAGSVDGTGQAKNAVLSRGWLDLAGEDCSVWRDWMNEGQTRVNGSILGLAKLIKYYDSCSKSIVTGKD